MCSPALQWWPWLVWLLIPWCVFLMQCFVWCHHVFAILSLPLFSLSLYLSFMHSLTHTHTLQLIGVSKPLEVSWWSGEVNHPLLYLFYYVYIAMPSLLYFAQALILVNTASQVFVLSVTNLDPLLREVSEQGSCITQANYGQFLMLQVGCTWPFIFIGWPCGTSTLVIKSGYYICLHSILYQCSAFCWD